MSNQATTSTGSQTSSATTGASGTATMLRCIGQIAIICKDVARATRFYRDTLGMRLLLEAPPGLAFFDCGGVRLMLGLPEGADAASASSILYYDVADIHAAYDTLRSRGVQFDREPHVVAPLGANDLWMAFLRDSEGNLLGIMSEAPRRVAQK